MMKEIFNKIIFDNSIMSINKNRFYLNMLIIIFLLIAAGYHSVSQEVSTDESILDRDAITGKWGGIRTDLQNSGITLEAVYKSEFWAVQTGNFKDGITYVDNVDIVLGVDFETLFGWSGAAFTCYVLGNNGEQPNDYLNSLQGITYIAAPNAWNIYNIFLVQNLIVGHISFLFGLLD
ncbi:MAG: porin, partial [Bacteroidota bacterium]|nr:porin [Bacteroidota bacterium]